MHVGNVRYLPHFSPGDLVDAALVPFNSSISSISKK